MSIREIIKGALTVEYDSELKEIWLEAIYPDTPSQPLMQVVCERVTEIEAMEILNDLLFAHINFEFISGFDIVAERNRQDEQWGGPEHDDEHERSDWIDLMDKFLERAFWNDKASDYETNLIRVAALAVAAVQSSRRKRG